MAISFNMITEIDNTEFDRFFNDSIESLNAGTYPWNLTPVEDGSNAEKQAYLKSQFQGYLDEPDGVVFVCSEDGYGLTISAGLRQNDTHFIGSMLLVGRNQAGSKSFMYSNDYHASREAFWDTANFVTWVFQTMGPNTSFYDHVAAVYVDTEANDPQWIQDARAARSQNPTFEGAIVVANTDPADTWVEDNVTEQISTLGNSSLTLEVHVPNATEPEVLDDPTAQIWLNGVGNTVGTDTEE